MKKYRIVRIAAMQYPSATQFFYLSHPEMLEWSYDEQQTKLFDYGYNYSNSFSAAMQRLGHESHEILYDVEILQKTWAIQHNFSFQDTKWQYSILLKQIEKLRPEILYFQDIYSLPLKIRKNLKSQFPFIKLVVIFRGYPGLTPTLFKELATADLLFVGSPNLLHKCKAFGLNPFLIYHYFDSSILKRVKPTTTPLDFSFLGSSGFNYGLAHIERYHALQQLIYSTPITLWIDEGTGVQSMKQKLRNILLQSIRRFNIHTLTKIQKLPLPPTIQRALLEVIEYKHSFPENTLSKIPNTPLIQLFPQRCNPPLFGLEMYQKLAASKITFNIHTSPAQGASDNIRLFHATGMGTCLLSENFLNIKDLFQVDSEVVTYSSTEECIEKVHYLLNNDHSRKNIAKQGQKRTLKQHTADHRILEMDEIFQRNLP